MCGGGSRGPWTEVHVYHCAVATRLGAGYKRRLATACLWPWSFVRHPATMSASANGRTDTMPELGPHDVEMTARILLAFALGALLGWERERAGRPAGLRTFMMVTAGSAAYTVVSIWGFLG